MSYASPPRTVRTMSDSLRQRIAEANTRLRAKGLCISHIYGINVPAVYLWHFPNGNVVPLCAACCEAWKKDVAEDPDPFAAAERITTLDGEDDA